MRFINDFSGAELTVVAPGHVKFFTVYTGRILRGLGKLG
jgi:hypothetical protein